MSTVSIIKCSSYDHDSLFYAVEQSLRNIDFDPSVLAGMTVAVKPNLLTSSAPESGVTTHPEFFRVVCEYIKSHKGIPVLVESPAFIPLSKVIKKCGYDDFLNRENIRIADTSKTAVIRNENGKKYKSFHVAEDIANADFIFNLPKMKTHSLTYFTGAVKNLFGTIHGLEKSRWHVKTERETEFISFLMDLYGAFLYSKKDRIITIMDGIIGLEGEGPGKSGKAVLAEAMLAGGDAIAVDSAAIRVAGLENMKALHLAEGERRGQGISSLQKITVKGEPFSAFSNNFVPPKTRSFLGKLPVSTALLKNLFVDKPIPDKKKCTLCYQCKTICPAGAIEKSSNGLIPSYDYRTCIRCYCCMEICPEGAIYPGKKLF